MRRALGTMVLVVGVSAMAAATPVGAATRTPWMFPALGGDPKAVLAAAKAAGDRESADHLYLLYEHEIQYRPDGARDVRIHTIEWVGSTAAVADASTASYVYHPSYQDRPAIQARVISPNGLVRTLDPSTIEDAGVSQGGDTFTDARRIRAPLPGVTAGTVVEIVSLSHDRKASLTTGELDQVWIGDAAKVLEERVVFDAPTSLPLRTMVRWAGPIHKTSTTRQGRTRWQFELGPIAPQDPSVLGAPLETHYRYIAVSSGTSWAEVVNDYARTVESVLEKTDKHKLVALAKSAAGDAPTPAEQMARVVGWLHKEIRYTGVEFAEAAIVPVTPDEVLRRGYGDCKDKALFLVGLLRALGQPAYLAVLSVGEGIDVEETLPSLGAFDHAIVFVDGKQPVWIDATAQFARFGDLPGPDQKRRALVIRPGEKALRLTPAAPPGASRSVEERRFELMPFGASRVVWTRRAYGGAERQLRGTLDGMDAKKREESIRANAKSDLSVTKVDSWKVMDPHDLGKPFELTLTANSDDGWTDDTEAWVEIPYADLIRELPSLLWSSDAPERKVDFVDPQPHVAEWTYHIVPPLGFDVTDLPESKTLTVGAVKLVESVKADANGTVVATLRAELGKRRLTAAEVMATREAFATLTKEKAALVVFSHRAEALRTAGKLKDAAAAMRAILKEQPNVSTHHARLARILLDAGLTEVGKQAVERAVELDKNDGFARIIRGWSATFDDAGRDLEDRPMRASQAELALAEADYRAARALMPKDAWPRQNLALILEYDFKTGKRYGKGARLVEALAEQRSIEKELGKSLPIGALWELDALGRWKELEQLATPFPASAARDALLVQAILMGRGLDAAVKEVLAMPAARQKTAAFRSFLRLMEARDYQRAADLIGRVKIDESESASAYARAMKASAPPTAKPGDPEQTVRQLFYAMAVAPASAAAPRGVERLVVGDLAKRYATWSHTLMEDLHGLEVETPEVHGDALMSHLRTARQGSDATAYWIEASNLFDPPIHALVIKEGTLLRVAGWSFDLGTLGAAALSFVERHELAAARQVLDWAFDAETNSESPFFHAWFRFRSDPTPEQLRFAAAALLMKYDSARALAVLSADKTIDPTLRLAALVGALEAERRWTDMQALLPDLRLVSKRYAAVFEIVAAIHLGHIDQARRLADAMVKDAHDDAIALELRGECERYAGKFAEWNAWLKKIGAPETLVLNHLGWSAAIAGNPDDAALAAAQKAVELSKRGQSELHTLALVLVERGEIGEGVKTLHEVLGKRSLSELGSDGYYLYGRIADQLGYPEEARRFYQRAVERSPETPTRPDSTGALARARLGRR